MSNTRYGYIPNGGAGDIPPVEVKCPADEFENVIRHFGVVNACEWFGHDRDSEFTKETIEYLLKSSVDNPQK